MVSRQKVAAARAIERLRGLARDLSRLETAVATAAAHKSALAAEAASDNVVSSLQQWNEALARARPNPILFGLAGNAVVRSQASHRAALLDRTIADERRGEAMAELALAEARLEGSRTNARELARDQRERSAESDAREAEDRFLRRRHR